MNPTGALGMEEQHDRARAAEHAQGALRVGYNAGIQGRMKHMVWSTGCNSWYLSKDGSNNALYPGLAAEYVLRARHFDLADYELAPR